MLILWGFLPLAFAAALWLVLRSTKTDSPAADPRIDRIVEAQRRVGTVLCWFLTGLGALCFVIGVVQLALD